MKRSKLEISISGSYAWKKRPVFGVEVTSATNAKRLALVADVFVRRKGGVYPFR